MIKLLLLSSLAFGSSINSCLYWTLYLNEMAHLETILIRLKKNPTENAFLIDDVRNRISEIRHLAIRGEYRPMEEFNE